MLRYGTLIVVLAAVPGCFLLLPDTDESSGDPTGSSELKRFGSEEELTDYLVNQITGRNNQIGTTGLFDRGEFDAVAGDAAPPSSPEPSSPQTGGGALGATSDDTLTGNLAGGDGEQASADDTFSGTTIQEIGVDEADVVKTDGDFLYVIHDQMLRIVRVTPRADFGLVAETKLDGFGKEIYLHDGMVIALTETYGGYFGFSGGIAVSDAAVVDDAIVVTTDDVDVAIDIEPLPVDVDLPESDIAPPSDIIFERPSTIVTIIDITDPNTPAVLSRTSFDGSQSSSRMIDGVMRLVVANYQNHYFDVLPMLGRPEFDRSQIDNDNLLPTYEQRIGDESRTGLLVSWDNLYRPTDPDGFGIVTVVTMDINDRTGEFSAVGVVAEPGLIYSSLDALYLTDTNWDFLGNTRDTTDVYKFEYGPTNATPVATGTVKGRVLNQYSMGEFDGYLRVATTISPAFSSIFQTTPQTNSVYILGNEDGRLLVKGRIENIAPGESIQSARFMGDRGYLVTFREIDPLFTLNLTNPEEPKIEGELKVPGFSTFIVPIDRDHLLTVGQYVPEGGPFFGRGVQLSVFDVSNFQEPSLKHLEVINGTDGSWSEALHNPKAFTYFAENALVALPVEIYDYGFPFIEEPFFRDDVIVDEGDVSTTDPESPPSDGETTDAGSTADNGVGAEDDALFVPQDFRGLIVYRVSTDAGFEELGRISTDFSNGNYWTAFTRGVFIDDDCFAVTNQGVRGARIENLGTILHEEQFHPSPITDFSDVPEIGGDTSDSGEVAVDSNP